MSLTASDDDNSVTVVFDVTVKESFFTEQVELADVNLSLDEMDLYLEYVNRPLRVVGDFISTSKLDFGSVSFLNFSPLVQTRKYLAQRALQDDYYPP